MTVHDHAALAALTGLLAQNNRPVPGQSLTSFRTAIMDEAVRLGDLMVERMEKVWRDAGVEDLAQEIAEKATERGLEYAGAIPRDPVATDKLERIEKAFNAHGTSASILRNIRKILNEENDSSRKAPKETP